MKVVISSEEGYQAVKKRVEEGSKILEGKWGDPKYFKWVRGWTELANALYDWELETGQFEKEFNAWQKKTYGKVL